ncbi:MAG: hypothetical protein A2X36_09720 [Elusimicrobia bacterium GWA2_69_24]|nr:MAG: hypothetical protein A2X36_09720 [Elusimicrobia bacterium GWA2_69_24]
MKPGILFLAALSLGSVLALAETDRTKFSTHLFKKFQVRGCTVCHDFHVEKLGGVGFKSHQGRGPASCALCHKTEVTGFQFADDWFARPDLYTSGMDARQTCEATKAGLNGKFKSPKLLARDMERHLFEDPRVLWGIAGATPESGRLPSDKKETDLVSGGMDEWKAQVQAWIDGGMKCD